MSNAVWKFERTVFMSISELKTSYHKVSLLVHPDKGGSEDAFNKLHSIYTEGLVWFKKSSAEFLSSNVAQAVRGTPVVPAPAFMKDGFPMRWARQLVTACELTYEYHQTEHGGFPVQALQFVINSVCRLKAYYEAWLEFGASPDVQLEHFAQSWKGILYLSTLILEMNRYPFNPVAPELTAAFAHVEYSVVDVTDIKIMGEVQLEEMFGDEVWVKAKPAPKNKTFTEQELEQFVNEAKAEAAEALVHMEKQMQELNQAKKKAEKYMKTEIKKSIKKMKLMEMQFNEQLDQLYDQHGKQPINRVLNSIVLPVSETIEKDKAIIAPEYDRVRDAIDSDDDTQLLTAHYKKRKFSYTLSTEPWASPSDLDTLGNVAFSGVISPGVHVVLRRDYNSCKGITVLFSTGRHSRDVVRGFIPQQILCEQSCPGMQKLTEYIKAGRAIAAKKGGLAPIVSPEDIFKYVKQNPAKKPVH